MSKTRFPIEVPRGSVTVKIYRTPTRKWDAYTVVYYQNGKRVRTLFAKLNEAIAEAETVATNLGNTEASILTLTSADRAAYLRARELLDPVGVPIEKAAMDMADAVRRLRGVPVARAVDVYLQRYPVDLPPRLTGEVVAELLAAKEKDALSVQYRRQLRMALNGFAAKFPMPIDDVRGAAIDEWLRDQQWAPRTRNNVRNSVQTLFNFARARKYVPKDHDELEAVAVMKDRDGEIEIFTPGELREILAVAGERILPFVLLGAFAGIRHAEIQRLHWEDIRLKEGFIEIRAAKAKTASRRTVPITPNLKIWLRRVGQSSGMVCSYRNVSSAIREMERKINQARKTAGEKRAGEVKEFKWKHNALRHSFISYRVAEVQNVAQVALEAGNSPQMIFKHYRELVTPKTAKEWFSIKPEMLKS